MPHTWDALANQRSRIYEEDGRITVKVYAVALDREDVLTLVQALLEAAGAPPGEAALAIGGITFDDEPDPTPGWHRLRALAEAQQLERTRRAQALLEQNRASTTPPLPEDTIASLYRQGVVPSEIAEVMGWRLSSVIAVLENSGVMDER